MSVDRIMSVKIKIQGYFSYILFLTRNRYHGVHNVNFT